MLRQKRRNRETPVVRRFLRRPKKIRSYSGLGSIPAGHAGEQIRKGCVVLEGGAFRGLYTQGVLDAWMQRNLNFECTIGVSAGAMAGLNYVSGQIGR